MPLVRIQVRRDTEENWTSADPILADGEVGYQEGMPGRLKVGNGSSHWSELPFTTAATLDELLAPAADVDFGGHRLTDLGDATADTDALNRRIGDARYDAAGTSAGERSRATTAEAGLSSAIDTEVSRAEAAEATKMDAATTLDEVPVPGAAVDLNGQKLTNVGDAAAATDALNRETADGRYDAIGSAASAQAAAEAASDPAGSADAAQAASLQKADDLSDLVSASAARTNLGLGSAATHASTDFDAAGTSAAETTRAEAAEALAAQKANNLSDLASTSSARTNLGLGSAATHASTDFDTAGAAATAQANAEAASDPAGSAATAQANAIAASAQGLAPTALRASAYTAAPADFVPVSLLSGSVPITLPTAPPDKTRIGVKVVKVDAAHANSCTVAAGGTDVFNVAGGSTTLALTALFQGVLLQYKASTGIWYVSTADTPLGQANGGAQLDSTGRLPIAQTALSVVSASSPAPSANQQTPTWNALAGKWQWDDGPHSPAAATAISVTNLFTDPRGTTAAHFAAAAPSGSISQTPTQRTDGYQQIASPASCQEIVATPAAGSYVALQTTMALGVIRLGQMAAARVAAKVTNVAGASASNPWYAALAIVYYAAGAVKKNEVVAWTSPKQTTTDSTALSAALGGSNGWFTAELFDNQVPTADTAYYELELRVYNVAGTPGAVTLRATEIVQAVNPEGDIPYYVGGDLASATPETGFPMASWLGAADASQSIGRFDPAGVYPPGSLFGFNNFGVYFNYLTRSNSVKLLRELGVSVARESAIFSGGQASPYIAPTVSAAQIATLQAVAAAGIKLILNTSPPTWMQSAGYGWPKDDTAGMQTNYANAVAALIGQLGASNVYGVQVYNEPNLAGVGGASGAVDPTSYSAFLSKVYSAVHAAYPTVKVFGGTLASAANPAGGTDAASWLNSMYAAGAQYDVVDIHAYPPNGTGNLGVGNPTFYVGTSAYTISPYTNPTSTRGVDGWLKLIKDTIAANGDNRPIFISETGKTAQNEIVQGQVQAMILGRVKRDPRILGVCFNALVDTMSTTTPPSDWGPVDPATLRRRYTARLFAKAQGMPRPPYPPLLLPADLDQSVFDAAMPWTTTLVPFLLPTDGVKLQGTVALNTDTSCFLGGFAYNNSNAQNDEFGWDLELGAGLWTLSLLVTKDVNRAIATVNVDGVSTGTVDLYNATTSRNQAASFAGIAVTTNGKHRITLKAATRNGSSTGWFIAVQMLQLRRTA